MSTQPGHRTWRCFASMPNIYIYLLILCMAVPFAAGDVPHVPVCAQNAISNFMVQNSCGSDYRCLCSPGLRPQLDGDIGQTCQSVDHQVALQGIQMDCSAWLTSSTSSSSSSSTTSVSPGVVPTTMSSITAAPAAAKTTGPTKTDSAASAGSTSMDSMGEDQDGISATVKVGVGIGLGVSLPLLAIIGYLVWRIREQRLDHAIELAKLKGWEPGVAMG